MHLIKAMLGKFSHNSRAAFSILILTLALLTTIGLSSVHAKSQVTAMTDEEALELGEEFGLMVGEVDEELREYLRLQRAEGVVVFEVLGGKPADLAGIKAKSLIKEIDSQEITTLLEFGLALKRARKIENFSLVTYEPPNLSNQGVTGGIQFHFVRIEKS